MFIYFCFYLKYLNAAQSQSQCKGGLYFLLVLVKEQIIQFKCYFNPTFVWMDPIDFRPCRVCSSGRWRHQAGHTPWCISGEPLMLWEQTGLCACLECASGCIHGRAWRSPEQRDTSHCQARPLKELKLAAAWQCRESTALAKLRAAGLTSSGLKTPSRRRAASLLKTV